MAVGKEDCRYVMTALVMRQLAAAQARDAPRLVSLMGELGYQVTPDLMAEKLGAHAFYTSLGFPESNTRFIKSI
jgi:hypothetical protein